MAKRQREKAIARRENKDRRPQATAKNIRIAPKKAKILLDLIRDKSYFEAVSILENTPNKAAGLALKVLKSAGANGENNLSLNKEDLFVAKCYANQATVLKRMRARAKGRGDRRLVRHSHITVVLDENKEEKGA